MKRKKISSHHNKRNYDCSANVFEETLLIENDPILKNNLLLKDKEIIRNSENKNFYIEDYHGRDKNISDGRNEEDVDKRIKYWEVPSRWDPNYNHNLYADYSIYTQDNYDNTNDSIDRLRVATNPINEFLHNRIVELIPLGIHNIWFYALKNMDTGELCFKDFGDGIKIHELWDSLDINEMMKYMIGKWDYLYFNIVEIPNVWSDYHKQYCQCFQFRGFVTHRMPPIAGLPVPSETNIKEFYPGYYKREIKFSYPFSEEQQTLRREFDERVNNYFDERVSYMARQFNRNQEKPIEQYIREYIKYETVRFAHEKHRKFNKGDDDCRTYRLSFHMKADIWNSLNNRCNKNKAMNSNRIWSVDLVNNNRNINSNMVISNMSDLEQPLLIADISKEKRSLLVDSAESEGNFETQFPFSFPIWYDLETRIAVRDILKRSECLRSSYLQISPPMILMIENVQELIENINDINDID